jgi:hypothetical protein
MTPSRGHGTESPGEESRCFEMNAVLKRDASVFSATRALGLRTTRSSGAIGQLTFGADYYQPHSVSQSDARVKSVRR